MVPTATQWLEMRHSSPAMARRYLAARRNLYLEQPLDRDGVAFIGNMAAR